ncbi:MAG: sulfatase [Gemmatimonadetes bacterium]|nr:sulfatase [Gemmatimonadota bacterium]MBT7861194.1 sulfatase [Gemmatimonadota bacterium]
MKRNILFIAVDDLRPEIGCFGKAKLHTPNLDRLASWGVQFDRAYCQVPICMPSRASLLSGVRPDDTWRDRIAAMCPNGEPSLPHHLKQAGYTTISIGKIYHYNDDDEEAWSTRYTDTFGEADYTCDGYCAGYQLAENQRKLLNFRRRLEGEDVELPPRIECADVADSAYPDAIIADRAIDTLRQLHGGETPFFLATGFYRPHLPWAVPKKYWDLYDREDVDLADNPFFPKDGIGKSDFSDFLHYADEDLGDTFSDLGRYSDEDFPVLSEAKQRESVHGYWASVSFVDAQIGRVLDELEHLGLAQETVVVLWGDNGWHLGEHKLWSKTTSFEESTRVPMIVAAPGTQRGARTDRFAELVDLYPTLCDLTGLPIPAHVEGTSLQPLLVDPDRAWKSAVFSRIWDASTVRTERYRLTHYAEASTEGDVQHLPSSGQVELFDLVADPDENVNVAAQNPSVVEVLMSMLRRGWREAVPVDLPGTERSPDS